jgi:iron complex outermembrane receptor protein
LYFSWPGIQKANPTLKPETIRTYEFVIEHQLQHNFRITADAYSNKISNNINQFTDPADLLSVFINTGQVDAHGVEFEAERLWDSGTRLRASYAWQISRETASGAELVNSPRHLAKLNLSMPLPWDALRTGMEFQYTGSRKTLAGATANGHLLANLTLLSEKSVKGLELSASIYNLFDQHYSDPAGMEHLPLDMIMQDGRSFRLKATYRF